MTSNSRTARYLIKLYTNMSEREQNKKLNEILERLGQYSWTNEELIKQAAENAKKTMTTGEILAYFDLLDIEDRT